MKHWYDIKIGRDIADWAFADADMQEEEGTEYDEGIMSNEKIAKFFGDSTDFLLFMKDLSAKGSSGTERRTIASKTLAAWGRQ